MRYLTLALALLFTLTITQSQPLLAQDSTDDDGGGSFISNLLEKSLSGDNRNVRVVGLSGALSSSATIQQIIISDDEGPWLTISNAASRRLPIRTKSGSTAQRRFGFQLPLKRSSGGAASESSSASRTASAPSGTIVRSCATSASISGSERHARSAERRIASPPSSAVHK